MTMITPSYLGETIEYSSLHACRSTLEDPTYDYKPFGDDLQQGTGNRPGCYPASGSPEYPLSVADVHAIKFTGKERDAETGLDYFGARYMSSAQGRWTTPDPLLGTLRPDNPQTLNRYAYTLNNPLRYVDHDGKYETDVHLELTTVLATAAGFDAQQASRIGAADEAVDHDARSPYTTDAGIRKAYHFTSAARRGELWDTFSRSGSIDDLGTFLHADQDSFSHSDQIAAGRSEHAREVVLRHDPDKTYNDVPKADRMARDTYERLNQAADRTGATGTRVAWGKIDALVTQFNRATSRDEKTKILNQIREVIKKDQKEQEEAKKRAEKKTS